MTQAQTMNNKQDQLQKPKWHTNRSDRYPIFPISARPNSTLSFFLSFFSVLIVLFLSNSQPPSQIIPNLISAGGDVALRGAAKDRKPPDQARSEFLILRLGMGDIVELGERRHQASSVPDGEPLSFVRDDIYLDSA
jgi:hypothetical protein